MKLGQVRRCFPQIFHFKYETTSVPWLVTSRFHSWLWQRFYSMKLSDLHIFSLVYLRLYLFFVFLFEISISQKQSLFDRKTQVFLMKLLTHFRHRLRLLPIPPIHRLSNFVILLYKLLFSTNSFETFLWLLSLFNFLQWTFIYGRVCFFLSHSQ